MNDDQQHLRLLMIFHCILAAFLVLTGCFPFIHLAIGIAILTGNFPDRPNQEIPADAMGYLFVGVAVIAILVSWSIGVSLAIAARFLHQRRHYTFCLIVAGLECLLMPFGTALGVFTIILLNRPSVQELFDRKEFGLSNSLTTA